MVKLPFLSLPAGWGDGEQTWAGHSYNAAATPSGVAGASATVMTSAQTTSPTTLAMATATVSEHCGVPAPATAAKFLRPPDFTRAAEEPRDLRHSP